LNISYPALVTGSSPRTECASTTDQGTEALSAYVHMVTIEYVRAHAKGSP